MRLIDPAVPFLHIPQHEPSSQVRFAKTPRFASEVGQAAGAAAGDGGGHARNARLFRSATGRI